MWRDKIVIKKVAYRWAGARENVPRHYGTEASLTQKTGRKAEVIESRTRYLGVWHAQVTQNQADPFDP